MTNYEKLFQEQMQDPEFAKAYYESRLERIFSELLENLKEKRNQAKNLLANCQLPTDFASLRVT